MKQKRSKLALFKRTVANLNQKQQNVIKGGLSRDCPVETDECGGNSYSCGVITLCDLTCNGCQGSNVATKCEWNCPNTNYC